MDTLAFIWRVAGILGASIVVLFLAYTMYCIVKAFADIVREERRGDGK